MSRFNNGPLGVGSTVKIINSGQTYSAYTQWVEKYCPKYRYKFTYSISPKNGFIGKVVAYAHHSNENSPMLAAVTDGANLFIVGEKGLKVIG